MAYSRQQEDAIERKMVELGFELEEDTGRRRKFAADKIVYNENYNLGLVIDHKSTKDNTFIELQRDWVDKVKKEAQKYNPEYIGVITLSFYQGQKKYMVIDIDDLPKILNRSIV